ncbi:NUDIX hydrolase [Legionella drancourtii]|uniref:Mutator MutT protein n=1 Tax=Legionella drancourtii LLAP12 TaxID=658187 RepID=G9ESV5_9GAMM|nr:NUDIX hydrolase [Legionella drancourtii]EHL29422.1 mutator MutT protein [Legionella drancourtii LLAP12]
MTDKDLLRWITEIQAIAQNGLAYVHNDFDKERYLRLRDLAAELAAQSSTHSTEEIKQAFDLEQGHATPKLDVRAFILNNNKLLMVKERADNLWSLPGGWADVNESPSEAAIRETKEETGFDVAAVRLLALWDKRKHDHPMHWPHTYKCFFQCELISGEPTTNIEISEIDFFAINNLPPLSTPRVTEKQLVRLYEQVLHAEQTLFD